MIKYIYYRLCDKHHEKGKRKNVSSWYASRFAGTVYFMMLWPFTLFFSILMLSSNVFTFFLGYGKIVSHIIPSFIDLIY